MDPGCDLSTAPVPRENVCGIGMNPGRICIGAYQSDPSACPSAGFRASLQVTWLSAAVILRTLPSMRATFMIV